MDNEEKILLYVFYTFQQFSWAQMESYERILYLSHFQLCIGMCLNLLSSK